MTFAATRMDRGILIQIKVSQKEKDNMLSKKKKKRFKWIYLQNRNRPTELEKKIYGYQRGKVGDGYFKSQGLSDTCSYM